MTEDKLHQLFQELKNEKTETSTLQINEWIESNRVSTSRRKTGIKRIFIGIVSLSFLSIYLVNVQQYPSTFDKTVSLNHFDLRQLSVPRFSTEAAEIQHSIQPAIKKVEDSLPIIGKNLIEPIELAPLPFLKLTNRFSSPFPEIEHEKTKKWYASLVFLQPKNGAQMDSTVQFFNELVILDSIKSYRSIKQFFIDDRASYLFMYDDYIVLSYRYRGVNFFRSGKAYESGVLMVDGEKIQIVGFMCDNKYTTAHFGQRFYLGVGQNDDGSKDIILFNYLWVPSTILKGHPASVKEKDQLTKLSNAQKNL